MWSGDSFRKYETKRNEQEYISILYWYIQGNQWFQSDKKAIVEVIFHCLMSYTCIYTCIYLTKFLRNKSNCLQDFLRDERWDATFSVTRNHTSKAWAKSYFHWNGKDKSQSKRVLCDINWVLISCDRHNFATGLTDRIQAENQPFTKKSIIANRACFFPVGLARRNLCVFYLI